jgi:hypothetical protein
VLVLVLVLVLGIVFDRSIPFPTCAPSTRAFVLVPVLTWVLVLVLAGEMKSTLTSSTPFTFTGTCRAIGKTASIPACSKAAATKKTAFRRA